MTPSDEAKLTSIGESIRARGGRITEYCIEIGRLLLAARRLIGNERDGRWKMFLDRDCGGISYMQALRFMRVAERYGNRVTHVVNAPFRVLAELAAPENDPEMVADLEARIAEGEPLTVAAVIDAREHWVGMPEFHQEDLSPYRSIKVHLADEQEVAAFFALLQREQTRHSWLWFTPQPVHSSSGLVWGDSDRHRAEQARPAIEHAEAVA